MNIRRGSESELPQLIAISEAAGPAAHWTREQWADIFRQSTPARLVWVAEQDQQLIGFIVAQHNPPEWELENIAVLPGFKRQGIGKALVSALLTEARTRQSERVLLEVRVSNTSAIQLYSFSGFEQLAFRSNYYENPPEDALIMVHYLEK